MPSNDPEYQKKYKQKHYSDNKERYKEQARLRKRALKDEVWAIKSAPCFDCGKTFNPWVMQFDHRDNDRNGEDCVAILMRNNSRKKLFEEIEKCDLVCANCHAERTYQRYLAGIV